MGLKTFTTSFHNIGAQEFLRPNVGYRYFFDVKKSKTFNFDKTIKLKYVIKLIDSEKVPKGELEEPKIVLDIGNIDRRNNDLINYEYFDKVGSTKNCIKNGDLIIPKLQPKMGNMFLNLEHNEYLGSSELLEYEINEMHNAKFVYYIITSIYFLSDLANLESGKTHRRVNPTDLLEMKIPLISKTKQDQIVAQIEPIEKNIKKLKSQIKEPQEVINKFFAREFGFDLENADEKKKNMIHYSSLVDVANEELKFDISLKYRFIFNKYVKYPSKNEWIELGKVVDVKGGKRLPKGQNITEEDTGFKYVRVDDLSWSGIFDLENIKFISEDNHKKIKNYISKENDILLTIVGATIGKCGLVPLELSGENITENFARLIILNKKKYLPEYINYCLQSKTSVYQIDEYKGRSSQGKIALFRIKKIRIPNIKSELQQKIVDEIKAELDKQEEIKSKIASDRNKIDEIIEKALNEDHLRMSCAPAVEEGGIKK